MHRIYSGPANTRQTHMTQQDIPEKTLLSTSDIATRIGRSWNGVKEAISRLNIPPTAIVAGGMKLYTRKDAETVAAAMRAPNASKEQGGEQ